MGGKAIQRLGPTGKGSGRLDVGAVPIQVISSFREAQFGTDNDRPKRTKARALCHKSGAMLMVSKLDRLSRRVSFIAKLMEDATRPNAARISAGTLCLK